MKLLLQLTATALLLMGLSGCDQAPKKWGSSTIEQDQVPPSTANTIKITVLNQLGENADFYASATSDTSWGTSRGTVSNGGTKSYTISGLSCATLTRMDLLLKTAGGDHVYRYNEDIQCDQAYTWRVTGAATALP